MEYRIEHDSMGEVKVLGSTNTEKQSEFPDRCWFGNHAERNHTRIWYFEEGSSNSKPFAEAGKNDR